MKSLKGALIGGIAGATLAAATIALAGTGEGGIFNLGVDNDVNKTTTLRNTGAFSGPQLQIKNTAGGAALDLQVSSGKPPLRVNSPTKVANLNADKLDGVDSSGFVNGKGEAITKSVDADPNTTPAVVDHAFGDAPFIVYYRCPLNTADDGVIFFQNRSGSPADFYVFGQPSPYTSVASIGFASVHAAAAGAANMFQAHFATGPTATLFVTSVHKSNPRYGAYWCHVDVHVSIGRA